MQGLLTKKQEKQMVNIIHDNGERLRAAMHSTIGTTAWDNPAEAAKFMTGVAAGIMVTLHWLSKDGGKDGK
jgi:hypothetical protein